MKTIDFLEKYVFVRSCVGCRELMDASRAQEAFCPTCRRRWDAVKTENCPTCFQAASECTCMPSLLEKSGATELRKLFFYDSACATEAQNRILYAIKHRPNRRLSNFLAAELQPLIRHTLAASGLTEDEVILVPLPRGRRAKNKYGFDQSELICRSLFELYGIPATCAIRRRIGGKEQKKLTKAERVKNLKGLFFVRDGQILCGKHVILFDDVVTTGAGMSACVSLLKQCGAADVRCLCLAQD